MGGDGAFQREMAEGVQQMRRRAAASPSLAEILAPDVRLGADFGLSLVWYSIACRSVLPCAPPWQGSWLHMCILGLWPSSSATDHGVS